MTPEVYHSIRTLVRYLYKEERRHWEESGRPDAHIFRDIERVANWLDRAHPVRGASQSS